MFVENIEKLTLLEQENFQRILNLLLGETFLLKEKFICKEKMLKSNMDYLFVECHFELFEAYLSYSGFTLSKDDLYRVIQLSSRHSYNRRNFDKVTTMMIYVTRLIYEEEREALSLGGIFMTTADLIHKMMSLGIIAKPLSKQERRECLRQLENFNLIQRIKGTLEDEETTFLISPAILFIISNEQINALSNQLEKLDSVIDLELAKCSFL